MPVVVATRLILMLISSNVIVPLHSWKGLPNVGIVNH